MAQLNRGNPRVGPSVTSAKLWIKEAAGNVARSRTGGNGPSCPENPGVIIWANYL
jgi:hypothetical protein